MAAFAFVCTLRAGPVYCAQEEAVLNVYSWAEYFPAPMLRRFEAETGIHVNYTVMDSNDVMETTLSAGHSGFDLVTVNASPHLAREIPKHLWQPLDKAHIRTIGNADPSVMRTLQRVDPGNRYAIPWMWGTVGVMFSPDKVRAASSTPSRAIDKVFRPEVVARYRDCGVTVLDPGLTYCPHSRRGWGIRSYRPTPRRCMSLRPPSTRYGPTCGASAPPATTSSSAKARAAWRWAIRAMR